MNKIELLGRLTKDVEVKYTQDQKMVVKFTIAINRRKNEHTDFFDVTAFGKTAEFIGKYFKKGSKMLVTGELNNNNYEKDGVKHYQDQIVIDTVEFFGKKADGENNGSEKSETKSEPAKNESKSDSSGFASYDAYDDF
jgi:single-strand DNA-binding protein